MSEVLPAETPPEQPQPLRRDGVPAAQLMGPFTHASHSVWSKASTVQREHRACLHTHTDTPARPNVWQLPYFICLENKTLICAPFKEKKSNIETFMKAFIGYNPHDTTAQEWWIILKFDKHGVKISTALNITVNLVHLYSGTRH